MAKNLRLRHSQTPLKGALDTRHILFITLLSNMCVYSVVILQLDYRLGTQHL